MTPTSSRASFWTGLTVGAILTAALMFSIYYVPRKGITFGNEPLSIKVLLDEAHGLRPGSPVHVSGVEAGEVTNVSIQNLDDIGWRAVADVTLFDGAHFGPMLTDKSNYAVARSSLLGEMTLAITPGGDGRSLVQNDYVDGTPPMDLDRIADDIAVLSKRLADFMDGREPGDPSLRRTLQDLQSFISRLRNLSDKLP